MPCTRPILAYRSPGGEIHSVTNRGQYVDIGYDLVTWGCGYCPDCKAAKARDWGIRIAHECQMHSQNSYVTLTYNDESLPHDKGLLPNDITKFFKSLRNWGHSFRYFQCGEYGSQFLRPHHHIIFMGISFNFDRSLVRVRNKRPIFNSPTLSMAWPYGNHEIEEVNYAAGCYVAQYTAKKLTNQPLDRWDANGETWTVEPAYTTMSRRPPLGTSWFEKYWEDVYPHDFCKLEDDRTSRPPPYYDKLYAKMDPEGWSALRDTRSAFSEANSHTWEDLRRREYVSQKRQDTKTREPSDS